MLSVPPVVVRTATSTRGIELVSGCDDPGPGVGGAGEELMDLYKARVRSKRSTRGPVTERDSGAPIVSGKRCLTEYRRVLWF